MLWSILHEVVKIKCFFGVSHKNTRNNICGGGLPVSFELRTTATGGGSGSGSGGSGLVRQGDPTRQGYAVCWHGAVGCFCKFQTKKALLGHFQKFSKTKKAVLKIAAKIKRLPCDAEKIAAKIKKPSVRSACWQAGRSVCPAASCLLTAVRLEGRLFSVRQITVKK